MKYKIKYYSKEFDRYTYLKEFISVGNCHWADDGHEFTEKQANAIVEVFKNKGIDIELEKVK